MKRSIAPPEVMLKPSAPPPAVLQAGMLARRVLPMGKKRVTLFEDKISIRDTMGDSEALPRRYTLTHSEHTGEVCLAIGPEYDREALDPIETRRTRFQVLAELMEGDPPRLSVSCRIDSEEPTGQAANLTLRRRIFEREMPFALAAIRYGDRFFFERHPEIDQAQILVDLGSIEPQSRAHRDCGRVTDYRVTRITGESRRMIVAAAALAAAGIGALVVRKMRNR